VWIGGDAYNQWRFFLPVLPALIALALRGCAVALDRSGGLGPAFCAGIPAALLFYLLGSDGAPWLIALALAVVIYLAVRHPRAHPALWAAAAVLTAVIALSPLACRAFDRQARERGADAIMLAPSRADAVAWTRQFCRFIDWLAKLQTRIILEECGPDCPVASLSVGMFGYYSRLPIIDVVGIVDPVVARSRVRLDDPKLLLFPGHMKTDADYVLARKPEYILVAKRSEHMLPVTAQLVENPIFQRDYVYDGTLFGFVRRERRTSKR
jgi:hypothetical protein